MYSIFASITVRVISPENTGQGYPLAAREEYK